MADKVLLWAWTVNGLTPAEKLVLLTLSDAADNFGLTWISQPTICEVTTHNRKTVKAALLALQKYALIYDTKQRRGWHNGQTVWQVNYELHFTRRSYFGKAKPVDRPKSVTLEDQDWDKLDSLDQEPPKKDSLKSGEGPKPDTVDQDSPNSDSLTLKPYLNWPPLMNLACPKTGSLSAYVGIKGYQFYHRGLPVLPTRVTSFTIEGYQKRTSSHIDIAMEPTSLRNPGDGTAHTREQNSAIYLGQHSFVGEPVQINPSEEETYTQTLERIRAKYLAQGKSEQAALRAAKRAVSELTRIDFLAKQAGVPRGY